MRVHKDKKTELRRILGLTSALFLMVLLISFLPKQADAATTISVKEINYQNSTITIQLGDSDRAAYFSDTSKKSWEEIPGTISSSNTIVMDISWITATRNVILYLKGSSTSSVISVTIPKQASNFGVTFNKVKGTFTFKNAGNRNIEWRKKGSTVWNLVDPNKISSEMSLMYTNGAALYFRLAPLNGTGISNVGFRPSKEVAISIPKKSAAPLIVINGSKFSIAVKKGMAYRSMNSGGSASEWISISSNSDLLLKNIAPSVLYRVNTATSSAITFQFRTNATSSALESKTTAVTVPIQEGPPNADSYGISLGYTSSSTLSLQVKAASSTLPFEYTVVKEGSELNYQNAVWTTIASSTALTLDNTVAKQGSHIYLRKKSVGTTGNTDYTLASAELDISGNNGVAYPGAPIPTTLTTLITTSGVCNVNRTASYLTFSLYSSTSTTVSSISFIDAYGITRGNVSSKSTVAKNANSTSSTDKYIITTKITSTENIDSVTEELLYAKITLANADVITSTASAGIRLYLYPKTTVHNPTDASYTNNFKRIFQSNDSKDASSFKFVLDLGTVKVIDATEIGKYTQTPTAISSIKYDGYTLTSGTDYSVEYGSYINDDEETVATATVTVNVANFETSPLIDITDTAAPLEIYLNNNEILDKNINIILTNTATLKDIPIAWSITEGSLKETKTSTVTNSDNTTTTVMEEVITYTLELSIFSNSYSVSVSDVTWGETSIFGSAKISGGKAVIYLSNAKINKLSTASTTTNNVVITLSNGYAIRTGCKLTILNAN
ncbi:MAG: hypothetical protein H6Q59_2463 [Firmicutes bacterium]|nr:hypothetical protein [Bacillota bacterium]